MLYPVSNYDHFETCGVLLTPASSALHKSNIWLSPKSCSLLNLCPSQFSDFLYRVPEVVWWKRNKLQLWTSQFFPQGLHEQRLCLFIGWSYMFREWSVALVLKDLADKFCIWLFLHLYDFVSLAHVPSQRFWFFLQSSWSLFHHFSCPFVLFP